jgi:hypothetical protein
MVDTKSWCFTCQEPHIEDEFPRRDEDSSDDMNFMDMIHVLQEEQVTEEHINEARRRGEREGRLRSLNRLRDDQNKELRRREYCRVKYMLSISTLNCQPGARRLQGANTVCAGLEL